MLKHALANKEPAWSRFALYQTAGSNPGVAGSYQDKFLTPSSIMDAAVRITRFSGFDTADAEIIRRPLLNEKWEGASMSQMMTMVVSFRCEFCGNPHAYERIIPQGRIPERRERQDYGYAPCRGCTRLQSWMIDSAKRARDARNTTRLMVILALFFGVLAVGMVILVKQPIYPVIGAVIAGMLAFYVGSVLLRRIQFDPNRSWIIANGEGSAKAGPSRPIVTWKLGQVEVNEWVRLVVTCREYTYSSQSGQGGGSEVSSIHEVANAWVLRGSETEAGLKGQYDTHGAIWDHDCTVDEVETVWLPIGQTP